MSLGCLSNSKRSNGLDGHLKWDVLCCTYFLSCILQATPLHLACGGGNVEAVKYLMEKGLDPTANDNDGWNSLSYAIQSRCK